MIFMAGALWRKWETKLSMSLPLRQMIRPTTFIQASGLSRQIGLSITLATETFQHTGSFKFRAAYHVASQVPHKELLTASSGNFGHALAYACSLLGKSCTVVMPMNSASVKVEAVQRYGGRVEFVDTEVQTRSERLKELAEEFPDAYVASPYDDPLVIEANSSLGEELCESGLVFDSVIVPVGGGGLSSGIISGIRRKHANLAVIGAEPELANDAARSLSAGHLIANLQEPPTIADGARTLCLGSRNWEILKEGLSFIAEVSEEEIKEAVRLLFSYANLKAEPTGALSVAALLSTDCKRFGRSVCCIISGGNVDARVYREILAG